MQSYDEQFKARISNSASLGKKLKYENSYATWLTQQLFHDSNCWEKGRTTTNRAFLIELRISVSEQVGPKHSTCPHAPIRESSVP